MSNRTPRVLHVLDQLSPTSGVASVVMNCITGITTIEQDIAIYGKCDPNMKKTIESCGGKVYNLPDVTSSFGRHFRKAFIKVLQEQQYTTIHGHLLNSAFIYLRAAKQLGVPHRIIHAHSSVSSDGFAKRIRNNILAFGVPFWANEYIAVSETAAKNIFGNMLNKVPNISIIHNGIDSLRFCFNPDIRKEARQELGLSEEVLCIGHVGRFAGLKNHAFLLDVFNELQKKKNCVLVLVGDGPLEDSIKEKSRTMGLIEHVKFLGKRNAVERLYQAFDIFMLPSLSEGLVLAAIEAQCAGLSCLVSENVPKTVACGNNIYFLPLGNVALWADTALEMPKQPRLDGSSSVNAARLNSEAMCDKIQNIYHSTIKKS